jgi:hypothetical protein
MTVSEPRKGRIETIRIPPPLLLVIEDVGWWNGHSLPEVNQPFRTGMSRMHCAEDYSAIIRLSRLLKTQILAGFVLCEWDRTGILRELPTATWMGSLWPGCMTGHKYQTQVVSILNENPEYLRLAMHGVGHECWIEGVASRSEFHDANGVMRDKNQVINHIRMFGKLLKTSGIEAPFPKIFIPPALKHSFGDGEQGFQKILADFGIRYVLTVFEKAKQFAPPMYTGLTRECGVTLIERGLAPVSWDQVSAKPQFPFNHPVIPLHWANILHPVPEQNTGVVDRWAEFLADGARHNGFIFLPDVDSSLSQIVYNQLTRIQPIKNGAILDISDVKPMLSNQTNHGFYVNLPPSSRIREQGGVMEPADHIQKGLVRLIPSQHNEQITVCF